MTPVHLFVIIVTGAVDAGLFLALLYTLSKRFYDPIHNYERWE